MAPWNRRYSRLSPAHESRLTSTSWKLLELSKPSMKLRTVVQFVPFVLTCTEALSPGSHQLARAQKLRVAVS
jgi:hypothetical protein